MLVHPWDAPRGLFSSASSSSGCSASGSSPSSLHAAPVTCPGGRSIEPLEPSGSRVRPLLQTFAGDPRAYRVRGTTIALRRDQSSAVIVRTALAGNLCRCTGYSAIYRAVMKWRGMPIPETAGVT